AKKRTDRTPGSAQTTGLTVEESLLRKLCRHDQCQRSEIGQDLFGSEGNFALPPSLKATTRPNVLRDCGPPAALTTATPPMPASAATYCSPSSSNVTGPPRMAFCTSYDHKRAP